MTLTTGALASPLQLKVNRLALHVQQKYIIIIIFFGQRLWLSCRIDLSHEGGGLKFGLLLPKFII